MSNKIMRVFQPSMRLFFVVLVIFAAASLFVNYYLAAAEFAIVVLIFIYSRISMHRRRSEIMDYIESVSINVNEETKDVMLGFPLPMALVRPHDEEIIWTNNQFLEMTGDRSHMFERRISDAVRGFSVEWLLEGKNECPELVAIGDKLYRVYGGLMRPSQDQKKKGLVASTCWVDVTELSRLRDEYVLSRPVSMVIMLDNYDELLNNLTETQKSSLLAVIDDKISAWTKDTAGYLSKYDRDRYIFIFEQRHLQSFIDGKFNVLESVREAVSPNGIAASLSIGIGRDSGSFAENYRYALLGIEMALSRGGDQAVVKNRYNFEFYGGRSKELEKRTKVKSRVMANSLRELMTDASMVFVMGHKQADFDAIGAAAGVVCVARKLGKTVRIIVDRETCAAMPLVRKLEQLPEYAEVFIDPTQAMLMADSKTMLIVVDTNRPDQVESLGLLESCNRIAVIDHHRRAAEYIQDADLNFHEPYASSASELVSEIVQQLCEQSDILRSEAEAMLTGVVLDTKNFTMRTGGRTFEAAAFLRRTGADTSDVKKMMQNDLGSTVARYGIIQKAKLFEDDIAVAALEEKVDRVIAAQAADELLNIQGISCSFVLYQDEGRVVVSARSIGDVNVQVVLEKLGGGGNKATAGAQIPGKNVREVLAELVEALDAHVKDIRKS